MGAGGGNACGGGGVSLDAIPREDPVAALIHGIPSMDDELGRFRVHFSKLFSSFVLKSAYYACQFVTLSGRVTVEYVEVSHRSLRHVPLALRV